MIAGLRLVQAVMEALDGSSTAMTAQCIVLGTGYFLSY